MSVRPWVQFAAAGALLLTGSAEPKWVTESATASINGSPNPMITTSESYPANTTAWPCPMNSRGTAPDATAPGFHSVGYEHTFDSGTPPFPCQYRLNHVHRLVASFDLNDIQRRAPRVFIDSAKLSFDQRHAAGDHECADRILTVTNMGPQPGSAVRPAGEERWDIPMPRLSTGACSGNRCSVDVKGQVSEWVRGVVPNQGFVIVGEDERLNANDNVSCRNEYSNFRLDIAYRYDTPAIVKLIKPIPISPIGGGAITLKVTFLGGGPAGARHELRWTGATGGNVDIYRDGARILTTANDGMEIDRTDRGTKVYRVCNAGTTTCSTDVSVTG